MSNDNTHLLTSGTSGHLHMAISTPYNGVGICMHCVAVVVCGGINVNGFYYWISTMKLAVGRWEAFTNIAVVYHLFFPFYSCDDVR